MEYVEREKYMNFFLKVEMQTQYRNVVLSLNGVRWYLRIMAMSLK